MANEAASYLNGNLTDLNSSTQASNGIVKNKNIAIQNNKRQPNSNLQSGVNSAASSGHSKGKGANNIAVKGAGCNTVANN